MPSYVSYRGINHEAESLSMKYLDELYLLFHASLQLFADDCFYLNSPWMLNIQHYNISLTYFIAHCSHENQQL